MCIRDSYYNNLKKLHNIKEIQLKSRLYKTQNFENNFCDYGKVTRLQNSKVLKFNLINTNHGNCEALLSNGENAPYAQQAKNVNEDVLTLSELFK